LGEWELRGMLASSLEGVNMPNDENIDALDPSAKIIVVNLIIKDLVVSKEVNKQVHQYLKDGANDYEVK
jgi:hypothetical protein